MFESFDYSYDSDEEAEEPKAKKGKDPLDQEAKCVPAFPFTFSVTLNLLFGFIRGKMAKKDKTAREFKQVGQIYESKYGRTGMSDELGKSVLL